MLFYCRCKNCTILVGTNKIITIDVDIVKDTEGVSISVVERFADFN